MYEYMAVVNRVIDGDTIEVSVDLGFSIRCTMPLRMSGINAKEIHDKNDAKREAAKAAKEFLEKLIDGKMVRLRTAKPKDKYGRMLAEVWLPMGEVSVNQMMIDAGHAVYWDGSGDKP